MILQYSKTGGGLLVVVTKESRGRFFVLFSERPRRRPHLANDGRAEKTIIKNFVFCTLKFDTESGKRALLFYADPNNSTVAFEYNLPYVNRRISICPRFDSPFPLPAKQRGSYQIGAPFARRPDPARGISVLVDSRLYSVISRKAVALMIPISTSFSSFLQTCSLQATGFNHSIAEAYPLFSVRSTSLGLMPPLASLARGPLTAVRDRGLIVLSEAERVV
ncbi:hypothetical protein EVAR_501_1 [Eumeta japonica]|uniref:Uncharacterized protein n=1 Tax=Eumeta variegata TaxID=151549 RepID=A0A4C1SDD4_EUMVA|nr:hypothetical protein EVAR_501_1 [Eumeta japonica]